MVTAATSHPMAYVVMGVSGCGKSTIAALLAGRLHCPFIEGDDLHPPANVQKMRGSVPLNDTDRAPWLAAIATSIETQLSSGQSCVVTCSALKKAYRQTIDSGELRVTFIYLRGDRQMIAARLASRHGHFMPPSLLDSQFEALEEPGPDEHALTVDIGPPPEDVVTTIMTRLVISIDTTPP